MKKETTRKQFNRQTTKKKDIRGEFGNLGNYHMRMQDMQMRFEKMEDGGCDA
jgi:hypothetical protein